MKLAGHGIFRLLGIKNQISKFTTILYWIFLFFLAKNIFSYKNRSDKNTWVRPLKVLRANAILSRSVLVRIKKEIKPVFQKFYYTKEVKEKQTFFHKWRNVESKLIKKIKLGQWPNLNTEAKKVLKLLQKKICYLSLNDYNKKAMKLIESYSMNILLRYICINNIAVQLEITFKHDNYILWNISNKIALLTKTKEIKLKTLPTMKEKLINIRRNTKKVMKLRINSIIDKILQKQLSLLLDPYYEAKYPEHIYGYRKGRNTFQTVAYLKTILQKSDTKFSGAILIDIEQCFDSISHETILNHFNIPNKWKLLLLRWLKTKTINKNSVTSKHITNVNTQGLIIKPLICNVVFTKWLYTKIINSSKLSIYKNLKDFIKVNNKESKNNIEKKACRNIIIYANDIMISTNNRKEIKPILLNITKLFIKFGLNISSLKTQMVNYSNKKKTKFNFLGFTFFYLPMEHIRKGGILTSNKNITKKKRIKTENGTYLVYPCSTTFRNIKFKLKKIIKLLCQKNVIDVFNKINLAILGFTNYYSWSNGFHRLQTLDGFILRFLKKHLINKFKKKGIKKPIWIAKTFLVCRSDNLNSKLKSKNLKNGYFSSKAIYTSPYGLRWHPHCKLHRIKKNRLHFKKIVFLVMATKWIKTLPITFATLPSELRNRPYYLIKNKFALNSARLLKRKINSFNFKKQLYVKQKSICPQCKLVLINSPKNNFLQNIFGNELKIYNKKSITTVQKIFKNTHKKNTGVNKLLLLHKICHLEITVGNFNKFRKA